MKKKQKKEKRPWGEAVCRLCKRDHIWHPDESKFICGHCRNENPVEAMRMIEATDGTWEEAT